MKFTTQVEIPKTQFSIGYDTPIMIVGSCFAQNIGSKMAEFHLPIAINPCGVAFNPLSVINTFDLINRHIEINDNALVYNDNLWCSLYHSTKFSDINKDEMLNNIESELNAARMIFSKAKFIIITLGTAWVYKHLKSNLIVNNCHKLPEKEFCRELLSVEQIVDAFNRLFSEECFRDKQIIMTVSPVRHVKDSLHGNNISKASLLLAIDKLVEKFSNIHYFPAYEIVIDELRDYRFYADDLTHPSTMAINYIWDKFSEWAIAPLTTQIANEIRKINLAISHKPINCNPEQHYLFRKQMLEKVISLQNRYPHIDLSQQIMFFDETH